jgi:large subunit ribosomal protein L1
VSFDAGKLTENAQALISELLQKKPAAAKGVYLRSITVSSTMGPGVHVDAASTDTKRQEEA